MSAARIEMIRERLIAALAPTDLSVIDESHKHVGHAGARDGRGHFAATIVSAAFIGKSPLERHRLVYAALGDLMQTEIHALTMQAYAPAELSQ